MKFKFIIKQLYKFEIRSLIQISNPGAVEIVFFLQENLKFFKLLYNKE